MKDQTGNCTYNYTKERKINKLLSFYLQTVSDYILSENLKYKELNSSLNIYKTGINGVLP